MGGENSDAHSPCSPSPGGEDQKNQANSVDYRTALEQERSQTMGLLAWSPLDQLESRLNNLKKLSPVLPEYDVIRGPEVGLMMVRGRIGGSGGAFNLGEMTVTRASVSLKGEAVVGHAYLKGRDRSKSVLAAYLDALLQVPQWAGPVREQVLEPLLEARTAARAARARKVATTKVDFFTMVRGE